MAKEYEGKVKFVAVDVDKAGDVAAEFKVEFMPTLVVVKGGDEVGRVVGADEAKIRAMIDEAL
ncbi:Thioredoxin-1 [Mariniblastus fucicola]|uniref:Thioredoxin-1 n=1 Tax=Mariniblastus fucicola TaxID=980251 RepID=A0A5B9P9X4_9BACT|nr:Thioredoxin-1 [Mariniblastus fucicola]